MKKIRRIYYFWRYFCFLKNHPPSKKLDILIIYLKEVGIRTIEHKKEFYGYTITFNDGTIFKFWDNNRWYSWMSLGEIKFSNGKKIEWSGTMPYSEVLYKYRKIIIKNEKISDDYTEYLPLKMLRKMKLKKLK